MEKVDRPSENAIERAIKSIMPQLIRIAREEAIEAKSVKTGSRKNEE